MYFFLCDLSHILSVFSYGVSFLINTIQEIYHTYCKYFPQLNSLAFPSARDLPNPGIEPQVAGRFLTIWATTEALNSLEKWKLLCGVRLYATPWTIWSMEFSRPEYWSGQPFPSPGDLPNSEIKTQVFHIAGGFFTS